MQGQGHQAFYFEIAMRDAIVSPEIDRSTSPQVGSF